MSIIDYEEGISRDTNVYGENVYFDNGQGCGTIWFKNVKEAKDFLEEKGKISGFDSGLCDKCGCSAKGRGKYKDFVCKEWKEKIKARGSL